MNVNSIFYKNPYYACYPNKKFGYLQFFRKSQDPFVEQDRQLFFSIIDKSFKYAYKVSIEEANQKILSYLKIGDIKCAMQWADKVNDVFYLMQYITNVIYKKKLYNIPTCQNKEFIDCLKKYWYCKRIDITPILNSFELVSCEEDGIDYMIIVDPVVNPTAIPPNQVK